ncbi:MAG: hypothetical protein H0X39_08950 [Actinobacteria bacterium]|nr:hypothetical protein [Actinomycetota bacterium]
MKALLALSLVCTTLTVVPSLGAAEGARGALRVDVGEWSVVPAFGLVSAGTGRIVARNLGEEPHELVLVRTPRFAQRFPLQGDHAILVPVASSGVIAPGGTVSFVVSVKRGSYALVDNLPWHYWKGTTVAFAVR